MATSCVTRYLHGIGVYAPGVHQDYYGTCGQHEKKNRVLMKKKCFLYVVRDLQNKNKKQKIPKQDTTINPKNR